ncbi:MAG: AAA family ATPase [Magnetococcales bacterium]|nr:AAA family ATPase [Magnetococcales bacterium]
MKILAVRGANLASLAGEFAIDFCAPPLADTGIFAITGKTGSGKSTLLDAISLALYNKIARIPKREKTRQKLTEENISPPAHDVRTILRTGSVYAYAEVDFIGTDKNRYRAKWQVRRARRKATGKLQNVEISLMDLATDKQIGGKTTETLEKIKKCVGLDFEQFNRTVLLSQGEFDAFLKARESERSLLLEALTGTEIYSKISKAVNRRYREENDRLEEIKIQLGENQPLSEEERQECEVHAATLKNSVAKIKTIISNLNKAQDWYQLQNEFQQKIADTQSKLELAQKKELENQPQRENLELVIKAQTLRPYYNAKLQSIKQQAELKIELDNLKNTLQDLEKQATTSKANLIQAQLNLQESKNALLNKQDELNQAATLDTKIKGEEEAQNSALILATKDQQLMDRVTDEKQTLIKERAVNLESYQKNDLWLSQNSAWKILEERFDEIKQDILQFSQTSQLIADQDQTISISDNQIAKNAEQLVQLNREKEDITATIFQDEEQQKPLLQRLKAAPNPQQLLKEQQKKQKQAQELNQLLAIIEEDSSTTIKITQLEKQCITNSQQIELFTKQQDNIEQQLTKITIQLEEARHGSQLARASAGKEALRLRALLQKNNPCPVCGAIEHLVNNEENLSEFAKAQEKRVAELADNEKQTRQQQQELIKNIQKNLSEKQHHNETIKTLLAEQEANRQKWLSLHTEDSTGIFLELTLPNQPTPNNKTKINSSLEQLYISINNNGDLLKTVYKDQEDNQSLEKNLSKNLKQKAKIEQNIITKQAELEREKQSTQDASRTKNLYQETLKKLEKSLEKYQLLDTNWQKTITNNSDDVITELVEKKERWLKTTEHNLATTQILEANAKKIQTINEKLSATKATYQRSQTRLEEIKKQLVTLQQKRNKMLGGKSCQEVQNQLESAINKADTHLQQTTNIQAQGQKEIAHFTGRQDGLNNQIKQATIAGEAAKNNLQDKCKINNISQEELAQGLNWSEKQITDEKNRLNLISQDVNKQKQQLEYLQNTLNEETKNNRPALEPEIIAQCQIQQKELLTQEEKQLGIAIGKLHIDNNIKKRAATLIASLTKQQKQTDIWDKMNYLIGSNNGDKFRKFAQSITLDRLIELANHHLTELTPRYRLQRAEQGDLSLQVVDLEMGSEIRGIANLSGGERFLTSLAMALGLAGMSSNQGIQVESLFIDEGFGALDETSLNMAISALEALQATGRVVGIISHIPALTERIAVQIQIQSQGGGRSEIELVVA